MTSPEENRPTGQTDRKSGDTFVVVVGITGLILVLGMSAAVLIVLLLSPVPETGDPTQSPTAMPPLIPEPEPVNPEPDPRDQEIVALKARISEMELEVMRLEGRIKELDPNQAADLAEKLLSPDPEESKRARNILANRAGVAGRALSDRILKLQARIVALSAQLQMEKGKAEMAVKDLLEAKKTLEQEKGRQNAERATVYYTLAVSAHEQNHFDLAEQYYTRALALDPAHAGALNGRGSVRLALGRPDAALQDFTAAVTIKPDFAPFQLQRGKALLKLGRFEMAAETFRKVLDLDPGNKTARDLLTKALDSRKE